MNLRDIASRRFGNEWLLLAIGLCAGLCALLGCLGSLWWFFDILSNFQPQYLLTLLCVCCLLPLYGKWRWSLGLSPLMLVGLVSIVPLYIPAKSVPSKGGTYKLLSFNVLSQNSDVKGMLAFIERENPDFIVMTEFTDKWKAVWPALAGRYRTRICEPSTDNFGIALFGRFDAEIHLSRTDDEYGLPTHYADFALPDGGKFRLVGIHSLVPKGAEFSMERDKALLQAARLCRDTGLPSILAGDFNATPFSSIYRRVLKEGVLRSSSKGRGLCLTWPSSGFFFLKPLAMQIDHCLVSKGVNVLSWRTGPDLGSDHLPVIVEFSL
jgi:endonuclease/exonuclease/phosphatase (EEP) superfamily protein YafD